MKITNEMLAKANEIANKYFYDYEKIAIRVQEEAFSIGSIDHCSHVWVDGEDTQKELNGICCTMLDSIGINEYFGEHAAVIAGNSFSYGEDSGEIIIEDAVVLAVLA